MQGHRERAAHERSLETKVVNQEEWLGREIIRLGIRTTTPHRKPRLHRTLLDTVLTKHSVEFENPPVTEFVDECYANTKDLVHLSILMCKWSENPKEGSWGSEASNLRYLVEFKVVNLGSL